MAEGKIGDVAGSIIEHARRAKAEKKVSLKTPIKQIFVKAKLSPEDFATVEEEVKAATKAEIIEFEEIAQDSEMGFLCEMEL